MTFKKIESEENRLLTAEQEAVLGAELAECLSLLHGQLAPYEEWAKGGDFTTTELLQVLKEDGIFRDLKIIYSVGKAVQARYTQVSGETKKRYGGNPPERVRLQALKKLTDAVTGLVDPNQPLMNEILNQTLEAGQAALFLSTAEKVRSRSGTGVTEEMKTMRMVESEQMSQRIINYTKILVFLARCRNTTLERQKLSTPQEEASEAAFKKYRWAEMELARPGIIPEFVFAGVDGKAMDLKVSLWPSTFGEKAMFEAFAVRLSFSVDVPHPTIKGFQARVPVHINAGLSKVHPEITAFANGYVSLEPFFEAYGLTKFYDRLKRELWLRVKNAEEQGFFRMKGGSASETVGSESAGVETVSEATQGAVSNTLEQPEERRAKSTKGLRTTTRNIPIEDVLGTLEKLGVSASRQNGTSHLILKGKNAETQRSATCAIPVSSIGDNSGPYVAQAARIFGFTRKDFLRALSGL